MSTMVAISQPESPKLKKKDKKDKKEKKSKKSKPTQEDITSSEAVVANGTEPPKTEKKRKSKKRQREEDTTTDAPSTDAAAKSPSKKARTAPPETSPAPAVQNDSTDAMEIDGVETTPQPRKGEDASPLIFQSASLRVPLPAIGLPYATRAVQAAHLSPMLLGWQESLRGVVVAYDRVKLADKPYRISVEGDENSLPITKKAEDGEAETGADADAEDNENEDEEEKEEGEQGLVWNSESVAVQLEAYAAPLVWVSARFLLFKPAPGMRLTGHINLQNEGVLTLIIWNMFSASVSKFRIPKTWVWNERDHADETEAVEGQEAGWWLNERGEKVEGFIDFWVVDFDVAASGPEGEKGFISIEGTLLSEKEEEEQRAIVREKDEIRRKKNAERGRR